MVATYYVTAMCNFRCTYCEHYSADFNEFVKDKQANTEDAKRIIDVIAEDCDVLYFTGGEPLVRTDIVEIVRHAYMRRMAYIGINTNALLIPRREGILDYINNLVVSLDSLADAKYDAMLGMPLGTAKKVRTIVERYSKLQKERNFTMTVNCVVCPENIQEAEDVMKFCEDLDIWYTISPQNVGRRPAFEILNNPAYRDFMDRLLAAKRQGKKISGADSYYEGVSRFKPFQCYPNLTARIDPLGHLAYPCIPLGGQAGNILENGSLLRTLRRGEEEQGPPPRCIDRCHMRCHAELSLLVKNPWELFTETFNHLRRRNGKNARSMTVVPE